ncbi:hypothetical protein BVX97_01200 [bacterium E08(2017)]|nr:hypothetical protein BVX97_01200 [bacterium E08(2017)]
MDRGQWTVGSGMVWWMKRKKQRIAAAVVVLLLTFWFSGVAGRIAVVLFDVLVPRVSLSEQLDITGIASKSDSDTPVPGAEIRLSSRRARLILKDFLGSRYKLVPPQVIRTGMVIEGVHSFELQNEQYENLPVRLIIDESVWSPLLVIQVDQSYLNRVMSELDWLTAGSNEYARFEIMSVPVGVNETVWSRKILASVAGKLHYGHDGEEKGVFEGELKIEADFHLQRETGGMGWSYEIKLTDIVSAKDAPELDSIRKKFEEDFNNENAKKRFSEFIIPDGRPVDMNIEVKLIK